MHNVMYYLCRPSAGLPRPCCVQKNLKPSFDSLVKHNSLGLFDVIRHLPCKFKWFIQGHANVTYCGLVLWAVTSQTKLLSVVRRDSFDDASSHSFSRTPEGLSFCFGLLSGLLSSKRVRRRLLSALLGVPLEISLASWLLTNQTLMSESKGGQTERKIVVFCRL